MADAVASNVILDNPYHYVVFLNSLSDGTGESLVVKADKSAIGVAGDGIEALALDVMKIDWVITGFTSVKLFWDHAADSTLAILVGSGSLDYTGRGLVIDMPRTSGLKDPKTADSTGDVLLTSTATSGGMYAITLWLAKRRTT